MIRKITALVLCFSFFHLHAHAAMEDLLKSAFDDLRYSLDVEWDGEDQDFHQKQMNQFMKKIEELKAQGLSTEQMIAYATTQIPDQQLAADMKRTLELVNLSDMDAAQAQKFLFDSFQHSYSKGANYYGSTGEVIAIGLSILLVTALVIAAFNGNVTVSSGYYYYGYGYSYCYWGYYCDGWGCYCY